MGKRYPNGPGPLFQALTVGEMYGRWRVTGYAGKRGRKHYWECECGCGRKRPVSHDDLRSGQSRGCGCVKAKPPQRLPDPNAMTARPEYVIWLNMRARCRNPKSLYYHRYGGRGIKVCDHWLRSFASFLEDVGPRPSKKHSLDRVDNDGDYAPGNCRWATRYEQARNRVDNHRLTFNGETKLLCVWAEELGISEATLRSRLGRLGWTLERAMTERPGTQGRRPKRTEPRCCQ
jgi:hypothetical protein